MVVDPDDETPVAPKLDDVQMGERDVEFLAELKNSGIVDQIVEQPRFVQFEILDAVFVSRRFVGTAKRTTARVNALAKYFQYGGTRSDFAMAETATPDLLDVASTMGDETAARLWRGVMDGNPA